MSVVYESWVEYFPDGEALTLRRLYKRASEYLTCRAITEFDAPPVTRYREGLPDQLAEVVARALARQRDQRFSTAREMSKSLNIASASIGGAAGLSEIAELIDEHFKEELAERRAFLQHIDFDGDRSEVGSRGLSALPVVPHGPADTSIASAPDLELIDDGEETASILGPGPMEISAELPSRPSGLPSAEPTAVQRSSSSERTSAERPSVQLREGLVARASGLSLPLTSPPTATVEQYNPRLQLPPELRPRPLPSADPLTPAGESSAERVRPISGVPESSTPGLYVPPVTANASGQHPSMPERPSMSEIPSVIVESARVPESRSRLPWVALIVFLVVGAAASAFFLLRGSRSGDPPKVVVLQSDVVESDAGPVTPVADAGATPDASSGKSKTKKPRKGKVRRGKGDRYTRAIGRSRKRLSACLEKHAVTVQGSPNLRIKLDIETSGKVSSLSILPSSVAKTDLGRCVSDIIRGIDFGKHDEPVQATIPLGIKRTRSR